MPFILFLFLSLASPLLSVHIDPGSSSFEIKQELKRLDVFDFTGDYPDLKNIDIDATRKMRVEMLLPGNYPLLSVINYTGTFGTLKGKLTGSFPELEEINFDCKSASMDLDFSGNWVKPCVINIRGTKGQVFLTLPENVPVEIHSKSTPLGKFHNLNEKLNSKGMFWFKKTLSSPEVAEGTTPPLLIFNIEVTKGTITIN